MSIALDPPWAITPDKVEEAVRRLIEVGQPRRIILFGSYVQGQVDRDSDLDILVVADDKIENTRKESVRLRSALNGIHMPMDILVVRESAFNLLKDRVGLIYREASKTGRIVYESEPGV
ncbi:MAG: nucleotidyltransferase domain-containing protein [Chloroflexi bacterium]|nr:nucleotidyltransferase domain-containing protein [Chloroflexota bacterium]